MPPIMPDAKSSLFFLARPYDKITVVIVPQVQLAADSVIKGLQSVYVVGIVGTQLPEQRYKSAVISCIVKAVLQCDVSALDTVTFAAFSLLFVSKQLSKRRCPVSWDLFTKA
jgi:hypothetical protein